MKKTNPKPFLLWILIILQVLLGIGALASGILLILSPDGSIMHMPLSVMEGSPFSTFFIPGLILFTFLGIYPSIIAYGLWKKPAWRWPDVFNPFKQFHWSWAGSIAAGIIVLIWLSVELIWVPFASLHATYYIWGALTILLTLSSGIRNYLRNS